LIGSRKPHFLAPYRTCLLSFPPPPGTSLFLTRLDRFSYLVFLRRFITLPLVCQFSAFLGSPLSPFLVFSTTEDLSGKEKSSLPCRGNVPFPFRLFFTPTLLVSAHFALALSFLLLAVVPLCFSLFPSTHLELCSSLLWFRGRRRRLVNHRRSRSRDRLPVGYTDLYPLLLSRSFLSSAVLGRACAPALIGLTHLSYCLCGIFIEPRHARPF